MLVKNSYRVLRILAILSIAVAAAISIPHVTAYAEQPDDSLVITAPVFDSREDYYDFLRSESSDANSPSSRAGTLANIGLSVIRSGNTSRCELYLHWNGTDIFNSFRYKRIRITNGSLLFPTVYLDLGDGSTYQFLGVVAATQGSKIIKQFNLDVGIDEVTASVAGLEGYSMSKGWLPAKTWSNRIVIG